MSFSAIAMVVGVAGCSAGAGARAPRAVMPDGEQYCSGWTMRDMKHWCIDPMSAEQASHRAGYTRMTVRSGKVLRVEYRNGAGGVAPDNDGDVGFDVEYQADGFTHRWFDRWGTTAGISRYVGPRYTRLTAWGKPRRASAEDGYNHVYSFDERGFISSSKAVDEAGQPVSVHGVHETRYLRDDAGHALETSFFDAKGGRAVNEIGVHLVRDRQGKLGCVEQWEYFDASMRPFGGAMGVVRGVRTCDAFGNMMSMRWFDAGGVPMLNREGVHGWDDTRDAHGGRVVHVNVGLDGRPAPLGGHEAVIRERRDAKGYVVETSFLGINGQPVVMPEGHSGTRATVLDNGEVERLVYVDANGQPVVTRDGYAAWTVQHGKNGRLLSTQFLDAQGRPGKGRDGESSRSYEYDERLLLSATTYRDPAGRPLQVRRGYAQIRFVRDDEGRITSRKHFDPEGRPVEVASARVMWFSYQGSEVPKPAAISREEAARRSGEALRRLAAREPWLRVAKQLSESTDDQPTSAGADYWYSPIWEAIARAKPGDGPQLLDTPRGFIIVERKD